MGAGFHEAPFVEYEDAVSSLDGRQAVGDHKGCPALHELFQRLLDEGNPLMPDFVAAMMRGRILIIDDEEDIRESLVNAGTTRSFGMALLRGNRARVLTQAGPRLHAQRRENAQPSARGDAVEGLAMLLREGLAEVAAVDEVEA